jgi:peptidoglycan/LPS O-acetylase OafA/YrhL
VAIQRGGWLDLLRFVAAFLIILYHYQFAAPVASTAFPAVFQRGYLVTDFFLIDSGYVLGRVYADRVLNGRMSPFDFFKKRALRVVPLHLMVLFGLVAMVVAAEAIGVFPLHPAWFDWKELPAEVLLIQSYGVPGGHGWNTPTWSLSALLGCYLLFPLLVRPFRRLSGWAALVLGATLFGAANLAALSLTGYAVYWMPLSMGFARALPLFFLGLALARFSETVAIPERAARILGVAAVIALAAIQAIGNYSLLSLALIAFIILAAAAIPTRKRSPFVERAALVSFSMYVTNEVFRIAWFGAVRQLGERLPLPAAAQWSLWAIGIAVAIGFAFAVYALVDAPSQRWLNAWADRGRRKGGLALA